MNIRIACFSDTHNRHKKIELPECDIAIFSGDMSSRGYKHEVEDFLKWYSKQTQCIMRVLVAGNHDTCFDPKFESETKASTWLPGLLEKYITEDQNMYYLENTSVNLMGLNIWGSPITPWFHGNFWAFNRHRGEDIRTIWEQIPSSTDIVVTHGPAKYQLDYLPYNDEYVGCEDLLHHIVRVAPKLFVCGHIHEGYGSTEYRGIPIINASCCNMLYQPSNKPIVVNIEI